MASFRVSRPFTVSKLFQVASMLKKGISSIAINSDTLTAASLAVPKRDLWEEAKTGAHRLIFIGPEMMKTAAFQAFITNKNVRARLGQFIVDELHVADEWGVEFRKDFQDISTMRARLPEHTVFVGLSASIEPGRQYEACVKLMGFRPGFHLEKLDCERRNVSIIIRPIKYTSSGHEFRDLDWLVRPGLVRVAGEPKYLVFLQEIEPGHRVCHYLRSLLPAHLRKDAHRLIRHHHSIACDQCKSEGMDALYKCGDDRDCLIHISTDVLTVGVDIPGLKAVIIFGKIASLSSAVQRAGRPVRERGTSGFAYFYVTKADMADAMAYETNAVAATSTAAKSKTSTKTKEVPGQVGIAKPGRRTCTSLLLVFAAHACDRCVTRQINMIYANPGVVKDCGRCSSCLGDVVPEARELAPSTRAEVAIVEAEGPKVPGWMKPQAKDLKSVTEQLEKAVRSIRWSQPRRPDALLVGASVLFPPTISSTITTDFLLITSHDIYKARIQHWRYASEYGEALWETVKLLAFRLRKDLASRHEEALEKQRAARLHKSLVAVGLGSVTRVVLKLPVNPALQAASPPPEVPAVEEQTVLDAPTILPEVFYARSPERIVPRPKPRPLLKRKAGEALLPEDKENADPRGSPKRRKKAEPLASTKYRASRQKK
ncbi:P-loop containing nucleoside triphosphate hydrolase protein [Mycena filopes]|nr:P-loop containing nucleoside triphosphate hydrolase protein [Mycena filopes]